MTDDLSWRSRNCPNGQSPIPELALMWPSQPASTKRLLHIRAIRRARPKPIYGSSRLATTIEGNGRAVRMTGANALETRVERVLLNLGRRDQQRALHGVVGPGSLVFVPPRDHVAAQAVRYQDDRASGAVDREIELVDPGVAMRIVPAAKVDPRAVRQVTLPVPSASDRGRCR